MITKWSCLAFIFMTVSDIDVFGDCLCLTPMPSISTGQLQQHQGLTKVSFQTIGAAFLFLYFLSIQLPIFTKQYYHKCSGLQTTQIDYSLCGSAVGYSLSRFFVLDTRQVAVEVLPRAVVSSEAQLGRIHF